MRMLDWLSEPSTERGLRFATDPDGWDQWSFARLAGITNAAASRLVDAGVRRGDLVAIAIPTGPAFIAAYFGTWLAGATPAPLVPPTPFEDEDEYTERTAGLLGAGISMVATEDSLLRLVGEAGARAGLGSEPVPIGLDPEQGPEVRREPAELALLQFTSGSTGRPRGVRVGYDNLEANIEMIRNWIDWRPEDAGAYWLPLYHDMGLIGCTLTPVVYQRELWILRPEQFVMNPVRWLDCFGRDGAAFTAGPNFCFSYAVSKIAPEQVEGSDFSGWRGAILGAERLDPAVLARFARLAGPYGFRPEVFLPAYGLAEATLAVTGLEPGRRPRTVRPDWDSLHFEAPVEMRETANVGDPRVGDGAGWLMGCGLPFPGIAVTIRGESGEPLPDGSLGEIHVAGPTVAHGYLGSTSSSTSFQDGAIATGDAGFVHDGDLYVIGRLGDAIKVRGKTLYAEDLEAKLSAIPDVPIGRCVVLPGAQGEPSVVAIVERPAGEWVEQAARVLDREGGHRLRVRILSAERGTIMRTSSGKPRRRVMWRAVLDGELAATVAYDSQADPAARS